jgi:hypothetical protein
VIRQLHGNNWTFLPSSSGLTVSPLGELQSGEDSSRHFYLLTLPISC